MPKSTLEVAKPHIIPFFSACNRRVWTLKQLETVLTNMREEWKVAQRVDLDEFVGFLLAETSFIETRLDFPSQSIVHYWWSKPTGYELAMSLQLAGYFSHYTAMYLNALSLHFSCGKSLHHFFRATAALKTVS
jgi:hypothetical protein